uniref:ZP domain-containing protein n=1 Tax=Meloidogyne hapla TaxID=6305 RepID=A0A1I8BHL8_MELHA
DVNNIEAVNCCVPKSRRASITVYHKDNNNNNDGGDGVEQTKEIRD